MPEPLPPPHQPPRRSVRGWHTSDWSWWGPLLTLAAACVGGVVLLAVAELAGGGKTEDVAVALVVLAVGVVGTTLLLLQRDDFDESGLTIRRLRTRRIPWTDIVEIRTVADIRTRPHVLVLRRAEPALALRLPRGPAPPPEAQTFRPPHEPPPGFAETDLVAPPSRLIAVSSSWWWATGFGGMTLFAAVIVVVTATALAGGWLATPFLVLMPLAGLALLGLTLWSLPLARTSVFADEHHIEVRVGRRVLSWPIADVERIVAVEPVGGHESAIAVLHHGSGSVLVVPRGRAERNVTGLVSALEAIRASSDEPTHRADWDPTFKPWPIPSSPVRWLAPVTLFTISALMVLGIPIGMVADQHSADIVRARSVATTGKVIGIDRTNKETIGLVEYAVDQERRTVELILRADEADGSKALSLRYDTHQPDQVWRDQPGAGPPNASGWTMAIVFTFWVPLSLGLALWLRWHPPGTDSPTSGTGSTDHPLIPLAGEHPTMEEARHR